MASRSLRFFDALFPVGRTNGAVQESPATVEEIPEWLDRYDVDGALVYHTVARDSDPELGNSALTGLDDPRLHKIWAFDPTFVIDTTPETFLRRALDNGVKAIMVNPLMRNVRIDRSPRVLALAEILQERRMPLLLAFRQWDGGQDVIEWYQLADFCCRFPRLPVIAWEHRSRANRPMFDALATAENLRVSLSSIWQAQMVAAICETFGHGRLVFSLGLPSLDPATFQAVVTYADISEEAKAAIASGNISNILNEACYD